MTQFWDDILAFSNDITARVGEGLLAQYGNVQATQKSDGSLLTEADQWADEQIRAAIASAFPDHGIVTEETAHVFPDRDWCWAIDPIDGTTNFARGIPIWGTSMGLLYQGTPVYGFVYFPPLQQSFHGFWYGDSGLSGPAGAFLNDRPIQTSPESPSPNSNHLFNLCTRSTSAATQPFGCKIRLVGVCTYSFLMVASGVSLGAVEATPKIWDIAAVWAILQAAGGAFISLEPEPIFPLEPGQDYGKRPFPTLVASRAELVPQFRPLVEAIAERLF